VIVPVEQTLSDDNLQKEDEEKKKKRRKEEMIVFVSYQSCFPFPYV